MQKSVLVVDQNQIPLIPTTPARADKLSKIYPIMGIELSRRRDGSTY